MKIEALPPTLKEQLAALSDELPPMERYNAAIGIIEVFSTNFRELIKDNEHYDLQQKIIAFKHIKPYIDSHRIEEGLRYTLAVNKPIDRPEKLILYYEEQLEAVAAFLRMNSFYYQYYKNGFTELDHLYFLPDGHQTIIPMPDPPDLSQGSSTAMTHLFAKFIAYERIQYFILRQIDIIERGGDQANSSVEGTGYEIKWTGDLVNLVEVAYGLWLTGQINHGNAALGQIVRWLETSLSVNMGNVQKKFSEIESRKRISITRYLDQMIQAIHLKAEQNIIR